MLISLEELNLSGNLLSEVMSVFSLDDTACAWCTPSPLFTLYKFKYGGRCGVGDCLIETS